MRPKEPEPLKYISHPLPHYRFKNLDLPHAVLTREGGVSQGPYHSLNLSFEVGDRPEHVLENRHRVKEAFGCRFLVSAKQVHGSKVYVAKDVKEDFEVEGFDALITNEPGVGLLIKQADCQAVLLYHPERNVLAMVHAGWRGLVRGVLQETLKVLWKAFAAEPKGLKAFLAPSLQPCCAEFRSWQEIFPAEFASFRKQREHFDLPAISRHLLLRQGLAPENIFVSRLCTRCRPEFFSYRREKISGRFGTLAWLP